MKCKRPYKYHRWAPFCAPGSKKPVVKGAQICVRCEELRGLKIVQSVTFGDVAWIHGL